MRELAGPGRYVGRRPEPDATPIPGLRNPKDGAWEEPSHGCPAGWRRSVYVASLRPYMRTRTQTGDRVPNPLFDRCGDPAIWAAVQLYEDEEERCLAYITKAEMQALKKSTETTP